MERKTIGQLFKEWDVGYPNIEAFQGKSRDLCEMLWRLGQFAFRLKYFVLKEKCHLTVLNAFLSFVAVL